MRPACDAAGPRDRGSALRHVQRDQKLAVADAAFRRDGRASAAGEEHIRRPRLAALGDAIGIPARRARRNCALAQIRGSPSSPRLASEGGRLIDRLNRCRPPASRAAAQHPIDRSPTGDPTSSSPFAAARKCRSESMRARARHVAAPACGDEHPREPGMQWHSADLFANARSACRHRRRAPSRREQRRSRRRAHRRADVRTTRTSADRRPTRRCRARRSRGRRDGSPVRDAAAGDRAGPTAGGPRRVRSARRGRLADPLRRAVMRSVSRLSMPRSAS